MPIAHALLPEFEHEMATTRTLLERVPEDRAEWKPHARSTSLGALAAHIATIPSIVEVAITQTERDMSPPGGPAHAPPRMESVAALLELFDRNVARARERLSGAADEDLRVPWSLKRGGEVLLTMPRVGVIRTLVLNHLIHHRGQLSVYLRLNDVPLPSIYGPTADT